MEIVGSEVRQAFLVHSVLCAGIGPPLRARQREQFLATTLSRRVPVRSRAAVGTGLLLRLDAACYSGSVESGLAVLWLLPDNLGG